jgi:phosphoribosylformylglycinamidine synthase subunit PurQ / glutaminase
MKIKPNILILSGDGINCEQETANAFQQVNANPKIVHINDLLEKPKDLLSFDILALPGGFSFGDDLGSGKILSFKLKYGLEQELAKFVSMQRPIIGICNGFQVLVKMGLLPIPTLQQSISLINNSGQHFIDKWAYLKVNQQSVCKWTIKLTEDKIIKLPIRHGEGRLITSKQNLITNEQIPLTYENDVNGSVLNIAGICDPSGTIFGLMPHPEAAIFQAVVPNSLLPPHMPGIGAKFFESIIYYLNNI